MNKLPSLHRRYSPLILIVVLTLAFTLLWAVTSYAGRASGWHATDFQVHNLSGREAQFTAHFRGYDGEDDFFFSDRVLTGCNKYYRPEEIQLFPTPLAEHFVGTLHIETDEDIAAAAVHFTTPSFGGNDVFETVPDDTTAQDYYAPRVEREYDGVSSQILVGVLGAGADEVLVSIYDLTGNLVLTETFYSINPYGSVVMDLQGYASLDDSFIGSATIASTGAGQPIWVDVAGVNDAGAQWAIYAAPFAPSTELAVPYIPGYQAGSVEPAISLQNPNDYSTMVTITPPGISHTLEARGSEVVAITSDTAGPYYIQSDDPVAAVVSVGGSDGASSYAALDFGQAAPYLHASTGFNGYKGWETTLWVFNNSSMDADVEVTFVETAHANVAAIPVTMIRPGEIASFTAPSEMKQFAVEVSADQPVLAVVEGLHSNQDDGRFIYRATRWEGAQAPPSARSDPPTHCGEVEPIPTLTEWGFIILTLFMVLVAVWTLRRRPHAVRVR